MDTSATADLTNFPDNGSVSTWAGDSVKWAVSFGLISGKDDGRLDPLGTATVPRSQRSSCGSSPVSLPPSAWEGPASIGRGAFSLLFLPILTVDNAAINIVWYFCPESLFYKFSQML